MSNEKRTYPTERPFIRTLARATLDVSEALKISLKHVTDPSDIKLVEKVIERNVQLVQQLNELLAEHDQVPETESRGLVFRSLIAAAKRRAGDTDQALIFSYLSVWMSALQEEYNGVQVHQLSKALDNLLAEQVEWIDSFRIEFQERSSELKD